MSHDLEQKVASHEVEIGVLKYSFDKVVTSIDENTKSNHELIKTLAVYTTKHDGLENRMKEIQVQSSITMNTQIEHSNMIASMKPVVDNLRGFIWKVASSVLLGGAGVAAIIISASKASGS